ncbi:Protein CBG05994 [Caenorhabditis briggsae]|uniref:Protein CBG05994 n=1 Tax=Caenorhabditis briggsae TaxID=6238 RepID=A8X157_CAEBR|nr:Protein CBG05994 [Caenorhabditis briggsae]CAP26367.1 Protein CBG05994 [Caenorhabditis briggsae]
MEVTLSSGMNEETILFIEAVIEENFTGRFDTDSLNKIQENISEETGGFSTMKIPICLPPLLSEEVPVSWFLMSVEME